MMRVCVLRPFRLPGMRDTRERVEEALRTHEFGHLLDPWTPTLKWEPFYGAFEKMMVVTMMISVMMLTSMQGKIKMMTIMMIKTTNDEDGDR